MTWPTVTICVPAYNAERTLGRTLDSLLNQEYQHCSIIVCDNASIDGTRLVVESYAHRKVAYVLNPTPSRLAEANWNFALAHAEGELIALYHADDTYAPGMVRRQVEYLCANPAASAVFTGTRFIDANDRPIRLGKVGIPRQLDGKTTFAFDELLLAVLRFGNFLNVPTMMARRQALAAQIGPFNLDYRSAADIDLYLRLARGGAVGIIDDPLHYYRVSEAQASHSINRARVTPADFYRVMHDYLPCVPVNAPESASALASYCLMHAIDLGYCGMNLLVRGDIVAARGMFDAIRWSRMPFAGGWSANRLVRLGAILIMRFTIAVGLGRMVGRAVGAIYKRLHTWRRATA